MTTISESFRRTRDGPSGRSRMGPPIAFCSGCGQPLQGALPPLIKRGAIEVRQDPVQVTWCGKVVRLSPTEGHVLAKLAVRGRATFEEIDRWIGEFGSDPGTRRVVLMRIRTKFQALGATGPFEPLGKASVRLVVEPDRSGSSATVIGLRG